MLEAAGEGTFRKDAGRAGAAAAGASRAQAEGMPGAPQPQAEPAGESADGDLSATALLAQRGHAILPGSLPEEIAEVARHCLLDWLGVTLAGVEEPLSGILAREVVARDQATEAHILGTPHTATALTAALVNGATSHALDFDDTNVAMSGHPSVPVLPAVLALAEREDASGADFLAAFVAGVETECLVGVLVNPGHYFAGWHATGTLGTFGAAAACASLLGLSVEQWRHALGLAGVQAGGLKSAFGTMTKPFHAGKAAMNGLLSATLAAGGFASDPCIVESHQGFAATHAGGSVDAVRLASLDGQYLIRNTLFKYHAACHLTHGAIEGALVVRSLLLQEFGGDQTAGMPKEIREAIDGIDVTVHSSALDVCNIERPVTGLEGKFSLRATVAMALLGDDTGDRRVFTDARMADPELCSLRDRVRVITDTRTSPVGTPVLARLRDGREIAGSGAMGLPAEHLDLQWKKLVGKFRSLAGPVVGSERAEQLVEAVAQIEQAASVRDLVQLACPPEVV